MFHQNSFIWITKVVSEVEVRKVTSLVIFLIVMGFGFLTKVA